jgi:hypothetical protein
VIVGFAVTL